MEFNYFRALYYPVRFFISLLYYKLFSTIDNSIRWTLVESSWFTLNSLIGILMELYLFTAFVVSHILLERITILRNLLFHGFSNIEGWAFKLNFLCFFQIDKTLSFWLLFLFFLSKVCPYNFFVLMGRFLSLFFANVEERSERFKPYWRFRLSMRQLLSFLLLENEVRFFLSE